MSFKFLDSIRSAFSRIFGGSTTSTTTTTTTTTTGGKAQPLVCVNDKEQRGTVTIGKEGGVLRIGEHRLEIPPDSLAEPVRFSGALLVDKVLKLDLRANDQEKFAFRAAATLTLSYANCEQPQDPSRLRIFKMDSKGTIIEDLGGEVNTRERTVTARLSTLSLYTMGLPW